MAVVDSFVQVTQGAGPKLRTRYDDVALEHIQKFVPYDVNGAALWAPAVVAADNLPNPTLPGVLSYPLQYNPGQPPAGSAFWERRHGQVELEIAPSAARTTAFTSSTFTLANGRGLRICLAVSAKAAATNMQVGIYDVDSESAGAVDYVRSIAFAAAVGIRYFLVLSPGVVEADYRNGGSIVDVYAVHKPRRFQVYTVPGDASSVTFTLSALSLE